jgi:hypothetical protein
MIMTLTLAGDGVTTMLEAQELTLTLRIQNDARIPTAVLLEAQATVAKIYTQAGVNVAWLDTGAQFTIIMPSRGNARHNDISEQMRRGNAMGYAPGTTSAIGVLAYVLDYNIGELARYYRAKRNIMLGTVIAHEVGHLLFLPRSHSTTGLMRGKWNHVDFQSAQNGALFFTTEQGKLIRIRLGEQ